MKAISIGLFFLFSVNVLFAQEFAPLGAKWYFPVGFYNSSSIGLMTYESIGDTVINNKACKILYKDFSTKHGPSGNYYFHQNSDTIYHYNESTNQFDLIIVFDAAPGDTFLINKPMGFQAPDSMLCIVDSISHINMANGDSLRVQNVRLIANVETPYDTSTMSFNKRIIEKVGFEYGLLPLHLYWLADGGAIEKDVRCYEDSEVGLASFSNVDCLYTPTKEIESYETLQAFPNPVDERLFLEIPTHIINLTWTIYDVYGHVKMTKDLFLNQTENIIEIDVSILRESIYFVVVEDQDNQIYYTSKFIKR